MGAEEAKLLAKQITEALNAAGLRILSGNPANTRP
jgi:hypothetical protein